MSHGDELVTASLVEGLHPATLPAPLAGGESVIPSISSGGNTYRTKVGFGLASSGLSVRHESPSHEHDIAATSWIALLPPEEISAFADELESVVQAMKGGGSPMALTELLTQWKATAEIYGDPELYEVLSRETTEDLGPVPDPRA